MFSSLSVGRKIFIGLKLISIPQFLFHLNFQTTNKWSCCSNADFLSLYNSYGSNFCLAACSSNPNPTTTPTPSGCGSPQWATDQWCDDENNNPSCNFDGGACCNNDFSGWDNYCTVSYHPIFLINNPFLTFCVIFAEM